MKNRYVKKRHHLMVVDEQSEVIEFLYDFFNKKGYDVTKTSNGEDALQIIKTEKPKILLLDIELKGTVTGAQILRLTKKNAPDTKIIIMTRTSDKKTIEEMFDLGAEECLKKPFSLNYLEQVVMLKVINIENEKMNI